LNPGKYQLIETAAPEGYEVNNAPIDFEVTAGQITNVSAEDVKTNTTAPPVGTPEPGKGNITLTKTDSATGVALAGAEYSLLDAKGETVLTKLVTNDQGVISLPDLAPGEYSLVETAAPSGYDLNDQPIKFTVTKGETTAVSATDVKSSTTVTPTVVTPDKPGILELTKVDSASKETLAGAVYQVLDSTGKVVADKLTTNAYGVIEVPDLAAGDYTLVEVTAPDGYDLNKEPIPFTITAGQTTAVTASDVKAGTEITPPVKPNPGPGTDEDNSNDEGVGEEPGTSTPGPTNPGTPGEDVNDENILSPTYPGVSTPGTSESTAKKPGTSTGKLPQTGNQQENIFAIIAAVILSILATIKMFFWKEKSLVSCEIKTSLGMFLCIHVIVILCKIFMLFMIFLL